jgi:hypothetical protein
MTYQPTTGERILITRVPGKYGRRQGVITGTVLEVFDDGGFEFQDDDGRRVYLGSPWAMECLAAMGITQTIEPLHDRT